MALSFIYAPPPPPPLTCPLATVSIVEVYSDGCFFFGLLVLLPPGITGSPLLLRAMQARVTASPAPQL